MDAPIAAVRSRVIFRELEDPVATAIGPLGAHGYAAVEIFTADGVRGIGYVRSFDVSIRRVHSDGAHAFENRGIRSLTIPELLSAPISCALYPSSTSISSPSLPGSGAGQPAR